MYVNVDIMDRKRIENLSMEDSGDIRGGKETLKKEEACSRKGGMQYTET